MAKCPTCGQVMPSDQAARLRDLLRQSGPDGRPLYTCRLQHRDEWMVAYTPGERFAGSVVAALIRTGEIAPVYPDTDAETHAYGRADYYGRESYRREIAEKIAHSKRRRSHA